MPAARRAGQVALVCGGRLHPDLRSGSWRLYRTDKSPECIWEVSAKADLEVITLAALFPESRRRIPDLRRSASGWRHVRFGG